MKQVVGRYIFILAAIALALAFCITVTYGSGVAAEFPWTVNVRSSEPVEIPIGAGETVDLVTTWKEGSAAKNLHDANTVILYYWPYGIANNGLHHSATGSIESATGGVTRIRVGPMNWGTNNVYRYDIVVSAFDTTMAKGYGLIRLRNTLLAGTNTPPREYDHIDWATIEHSNVGEAPFVSSYDIDDVREFMTSAQDGTADLDINSLIVRTPYGGSETFFPSYLMRSNAIPTGVITNAAKGEDEAVGRIERVDQHNILVHFPLTSEGEVTTTNRLYWIVDGQAIGYVSSNGITMIKGSLQLYEEDLNCNVRAYDGAKEAPSVTFYASPLSGWYRKSVSGAGAWAYAHNSNDVGYINNAGWMLLGTRTYTGYGADLGYCDVSDSYRFGGVHGRSTNITVLTGILTNGSGSVTGLVHETFTFGGGILTP